MSKHSVGLIIFNIIVWLAFICIVVFCFENMPVYAKVCNCIYAVTTCRLFIVNITQEDKRHKQYEAKLKGGSK